jgi:hypothetical protein
MYMSDFAMTQNMLLDAIQRISGYQYTAERINSSDFIKEKQAAVDAGDKYATYALIETGFVTGKFGGHLEKEGAIMNSLLGLPPRGLDEVVRSALEAVDHA